MKKKKKTWSRANCFRRLINLELSEEARKEVGQADYRAWGVWNALEFKGKREEGEEEGIGWFLSGAPVLRHRCINQFPITRVPLETSVTSPWRFGIVLGRPRPWQMAGAWQGPASSRGDTGVSSALAAYCFLKSDRNLCDSRSRSICEACLPNGDQARARSEWETRRIAGPSVVSRNGEFRAGNYPCQFIPITRTVSRYCPLIWTRVPWMSQIARKLKFIYKRFQVASQGSVIESSTAQLTIETCSSQKLATVAFRTINRSQRNSMRCRLNRLEFRWNLFNNSSILQIRANLNDLMRTAEKLAKKRFASDLRGKMQKSRTWI